MNKIKNAIENIRADLIKQKKESVILKTGTEIFQSEKNREKRMEKRKESLYELWYTIKRISL